MDEPGYATRCLGSDNMGLTRLKKVRRVVGGFFPRVFQYARARSEL